ncbi:MAG: Gfo/Idh/MocA family oxidoreductase [Acidobacteriia bacterium]|nr:Gfo/Idh/MocA family oxidoreductase [Terriglobia bacterium]
MTLRWGILGTARIAEEQVIPAIRAEEGHELVAVASRDEAKAQAWARTVGASRAYGSYEALLADPDVDAVYIPLPNHLHAEWTRRAAEAGKHVLCEKPAALTAPELDGMICTCEKHGVVFMEAFMYAFHPQWARVREWLASGKLGDVIEVRSRHGFILDRPEDIRWDPAMGGGALYDVGCYCVHAMVSTFGEDLPQSIAAIAHRSPSGVDATLRALFRMNGGVIGTFQCSFEQPRAQGFTILGSGGVLHLNLPFRPDRGLPQLTVEVRGSTITELFFEDFPIYQAEIRYFAECIAQGRQPEREHRWSLATARWLDAIHAAARAES